MEDKGGVYTIIVGAKGAEKTSAVARLLHGKKGVMTMLVSDTDTPKSIISLLVKECGIEVKQGLDIVLKELN